MVFILIRICLKGPLYEERLANTVLAGLFVSEALEVGDL